MSEQRMECFFSFEVNAPNGFERISKDLNVSDLNLFTWKSGYNGKFILRSQHPGIIELEMDSSETEYMCGSGLIHTDYHHAKKILEQFSDILKFHEYPHNIGIDNETGSETHNLSYNWNTNSS